MYKILGLALFLVTYQYSVAQNFSFNCTKDTTIECTTTCLTLKSTIPDIYSSTTSYTVNKFSSISCFRGYVNPEAPGLPAGLNIDDRYSPPINITFPFSFYGITYNQLIASTNGFLSFDVSKTGTFSHFGILKNGSTLSSSVGTPENLPSSLFDKALIMGPYHDLDPNISTSTQQIKYEVIGSAPYRKWIISYFNVPLYTTACLNLNSNTHQIVLYETLGIVEIFIYDKEICLSWNNGRAMIGMQDANKSAGITAPNRSATSTPWGGKSFNESWRFVPASGQSLFKRVELYTASGQFIKAGAVSNGGNNLLNVSFPNVCPPSAGETYLIKSFYKNPNNSSEEIVGIDTVNISRGDPVTFDLIQPACSDGSNGTITITNPIGPTYEYSLDGINWQSSNIFFVKGGTFLIRSRIKGSACISSKSIEVTRETFEAAIIKKIIPCPGPLTANIEIVPKYGVPAYQYSLDNQPFQSSNTYTGLVVGTYKLVVIDARGCNYTTEFRIDSIDLAEATVTNTLCGKPGSGTITVSPSYGSAPYTYTLDSVFQSSNTFTGLKEGVYNITIKDSAACAYTFQARVSADVSFNIDPKIIMPLCYGEKNGSIILRPNSGIRPYSFSLNDQAFQQDSVYNNLGNGTYKIRVKDSTGCIKDSTIIVQQPNPVSGTLIITPASNCLSTDGEITVKANGGTIPFTFSIDEAATFQLSNVFTQPAGAFKIVIKDSNNCQATLTDTVLALNTVLKVDAGPDISICEGSTTTLSVKSDRTLTNFSWSPPITTNNSLAGLSVVSPSDTAMYYVTAGNGVCWGRDSVTVNVLHKPIAFAGKDTTICYNTVATLNGSSINPAGPVSYLWLPSASIQNPTSPTTLVRPGSARRFTYRLQVTDNYGCNFKVYDDVSVTMKPAVVAFAGKDTVAGMGLPHQLFGTGGVEYLWSPANLLNKPDIQNPIATLQADTEFNLMVKDALGCIGTSSVYVKVYKGPAYYIPNAFTPNNDGMNDVFKAAGPGIKQTHYFRIFDRWGKLMFETSDMNKGWDGRFSGVAQPTSVYVWMIKGIDIAGKPVELKGTVTLIR